MTRVCSDDIKPPVHQARACRTQRGTRPGPNRASLCVALLSSTLAIAVAFWALGERGTYHELLALDAPGVPPAALWVVATLGVGKSLVLLVPLALACALLPTARWRRAALWLHAGLVWLLLTLLKFDIALYASVGRHVADLLWFAALPEGHQAAGNLRQWVISAMKAALFALALVIPAALAQRWLLSGALRSASRLLLWSASGCLLMLCCVPLLAMDAWPDAWRHAALVERTYAVSPIDPRWRGGAGNRPGDPRLAELQAALQASYRRSFALLQQPRAPDPPQARPPHAPDVLLLVLESLRPDALQWMPRLRAWTRRSLLLTRHYAGSKYSEAGLFALLYGRSPLTYHSTLDAGLGATLALLLQAQGYQTGYYTGHPVKWLRREEFLGPGEVDHFVHDDRGGWNDWDRHALGNAVDALRRPGPALAIVFLMSSHFEYQYPKEYERHRPVAHTSWTTDSVKALTAEAEQPHRNRYMNTLAFLDDLIADHLSELALDDTLVVMTGDHGESINDDGRFGHGYAYPDVVAQVPMVLAGPGIEQGQRKELTLHVDVLPTLMHAIHGRDLELPHLDGRDLLAGDAPREGALLAWAEPNGKRAQALLLAGQERLGLFMNLESPTLTLLGLEDPLAHPLADQSLTVSQAKRAARVFQRTLDRAAR